MSERADIPAPDEEDPFREFEGPPDAEGLEPQFSPHTLDELRRTVDEDWELVARRVAIALRTCAWLLEPREVVSAALCRMLLYNEEPRATSEKGAFIDAQIEASMKSELTRDQEEERASVPITLPVQKRFSFLAEALGIPMETTRTACIVLNDAEQPLRGAFFECVLMRREVDDYAANSGHTSAEVLALLETTLERLDQEVWAIDPAILQSGRHIEPFNLDGGRHA